MGFDEGVPRMQSGCLEVVKSGGLGVGVERDKAGRD